MLTKGFPASLIFIAKTMKSNIYIMFLICLSLRRKLVDVSPLSTHFFVVVLGVVLSLRLHRLRGAQGLQTGGMKDGIQSMKGAAVEGSEEGSVGEAAVQEGSSDTLMELLKLRVSRDPSGLSEERE